MTENSKPTTQARSAVLREAFINAGFELLNEYSLDQLTVPQIAKTAGSSVGGFYSRFKNKDTFFLCLRDEQIRHDREFEQQNLPLSLLETGSPDEVIAAVVDTYTGIFTGKGRGVLRTAFLKMHEDPTLWEPMRENGRRASDYLSTHVGPRLGEDGELRARFAIQVLMSALVNDLVNPNHPIKAQQPEFRAYLFDMLATFLTPAGKAAETTPGKVAEIRSGDADQP
ncbi:MAG: TetR/AcrR family transcriptional regulator [Oceanobacter sp.]